MMQKLANDHRNDFDVTVFWVPGHSNIHGNEEADKQAKKAAEGRQNNSPQARLPHYLRFNSLPLSISALKQAHRQSTQERWSRSWSKSPRYARTHSIDPNILHRSFVKLTKSYPKRLTGLLMCLRTHHAPLNQHLHRISKSLTPSCPHCPNIDENIHHFLLACPHYQQERHAMINALGRKATSIPYLLTDEAAIPHLTRYVNATGRLKSIFGEITMLSKRPN
jgi:hypothetical protein